MKPLPVYGDHMTMEEFIETCESGCFIDYDGHGRYATAEQMSDEMVLPSDVTSGNVNRRWTHVMWFNR